jgi:hypothetical protein
MWCSGISFASGGSIPLNNLLRTHSYGSRRAGQECWQAI